MTDTAIRESSPIDLIHILTPDPEGIRDLFARLELEALEEEYEMGTMEPEDWTPEGEAIALERNPAYQVYLQRSKEIAEAPSHLELRNESDPYLLSQGLLWSVVVKAADYRISSHAEWKDAERAYYYHDKAHRDLQMAILTGEEEDYRYTER